MNDADCDITWSGRKKEQHGMGYICEVEFDGKAGRYRRSNEENSCQVEYRTRKGIVENVQMSCKGRF